MKRTGKPQWDVKKKSEQKKLEATAGHLKQMRAEYAQKWSAANAANFEINGHYDWMTSLIQGYEKVLEIGTGDRRGTLALLKDHHTVVSVDENPEILALAQQRLEDAGKTVIYHKRETIKAAVGGYSIIYQQPDPYSPHVDVHLLEADINNDNTLIGWQKEAQPFDAVVCWLIGTHTARRNNAIIQNANITSSGLYRLLVQNRVYQVADEVLRPGGVLQIVDRGQPPLTTIIEQDLFHAHQEQAQSTSLVPTSLKYRMYEETTNTTGINMQVTLGLSGLLPKSDELAFIAMLSKKSVQNAE